MTKIKNILVPADFSKGFTHTLNYAIEMAKAFGAELHIIHVIEPVVFSSDTIMTKFGLDELSNELEILAKFDLEKIAFSLEEKKLTFTTKVLHGKADEEILYYAGKNQIDMICIATHGHGTIENFLIGSTAEKVLRKAECPVLAVKVKK